MNIKNFEEIKTFIKINDENYSNEIKIKESNFKIKNKIINIILILDLIVQTILRFIYDNSMLLLFILLTFLLLSIKVYLIRKLINKTINIMNDLDKRETLLTNNLDKTQIMINMSGFSILICLIQICILFI